MQKFVKFRFTLSALSATEFIFVMLSDLRVRSAIVNGLHFWSDSKGLEMKTYTLTWFRPDTWRKNGICRCRFDCFSCYWLVGSLSTPIHAFKVLLSLNMFPFGDCNFRLSSCGKLVARSATYQGV